MTRVAIQVESLLIRANFHHISIINHLQPTYDSLLITKSNKHFCLPTKNSNDMVFMMGN